MTTEEFKQEAQAARPQLMAVARRYLNDADEAEDVVQDALLRLWQMNDRLRSPLLPLALVVTRNLAVDLKRRQHRIEPIGQEVAEADTVTDERLDRVLSIVDKLPPMQQTILRLRHMEGMEMSDIAELIGSNEVAVRKALSRARMAVRQQYLKKMKNK